MRTGGARERVFSVADFRTWKDELPFRYGIDERTPNLFYITTEQLRLSTLPEGPVLIVSDSELQQWRPAYTGWKAWPREAMEQFEQRWPLGTSARTC